MILFPFNYWPIYFFNASLCLCEIKNPIVPNLFGSFDHRHDLAQRIYLDGVSTYALRIICVRVCVGMATQTHA